MSQLELVAENLWVASAPQTFLSFHVGTRMTVVRLSSGALLLHSPIPIDDAFQAQIDAMGEVRHIACPNSYHHLYAGPAMQRWPRALLHGPRALQRKRKDLSFHAELGATPHPDFAADLQPIVIEGCALGETVLYHAASKTLITSDLVENFKSCDHAPTRWWLKLGGILGRPGWHRLMRVVYTDRKKARASLERILALPFERLIVAHGEIISHDARSAVREGLAWI